MIEPRHEKFYWTGTHETAVAAALVRLLNPGDIFWDVGAHIGYFSLIARRLVGPSGQVHAFEPIQANVDRLQQGVSSNRATNVIVHPVAIADRQGEILLRSRENSTLMWSMVLGNGNGHRVPCTTLDAVLDHARRPSLVKLDTEGAEAAILKAARRVMSLGVVFVLEILSEEARSEIHALYPHHVLQRLDAKNWLMAPSLP